MMPDDLDTWIKLITFIMAAGTAVYTFYATRSTKVDQRFKEGSDRMNGLEKRIASTEQIVSSLPTTSDFHRLELRLTEIGGELKTMRAERIALTDTLARMEIVLLRHEDHLLEGAKS
jgi:hypothetical protein